MGWDADGAFDGRAVEGRDAGGRSHILWSWHVVQVVQVLWTVMAASGLALGAVGTFWYMQVMSVLIVCGWGGLGSQ